MPQSCLTQSLQPLKTKLLAKSAKCSVALLNTCNSVLCCLNRHHVFLNNSRSHLTDTNTKLTYCTEKILTLIGVLAIGALSDAHKSRAS